MLGHIKPLLQAILQDSQDFPFLETTQAILEQKHKIRGKYKKNYKYIKLSGVKLKLRLSYEDKVLEQAHRNAIGTVRSTISCDCK